jgi:hypothetical protein
MAVRETVFEFEYEYEYEELEKQPRPCCALIPLDTGKIRRKAIGTMKRSRTAYSKAEAEWIRFNEEELPAYQQWFRQHCGARMSELRRILQQISYKQMLIQQVDYESRRTGKLLGECYHEVKYRLEHPEEFKDRDYEDFEEEAQDMPPGDEEDIDDCEPPDPGDEIDEEYEELFKEFEPYIRAALSGTGLLEEEEDDEEEEAMQRLREEKEKRRITVRAVFRDIARMLHPDAGGNMDEMNKRTWVSAQRAYAAGDLDQLELIRSHIWLNGDINALKDASVSHILNLTDAFRASLKALRTVLRRIRKEDPAWGFLNWDEMQKDLHLEKLNGMLDHDINDRTAYLDELNDLIANIEAEAEWCSNGGFGGPAQTRSQSRRRLRHDSWHMAFDF